MVTYEHTLQLPIPAFSALLLMLNTKENQSLNSGMLLGSQSSRRRPDAVAGGCRHDPADRRDRASPGHRGARSHHRRPRRACEPEAAEADVTTSSRRVDQGPRRRPDPAKAHVMAHAMFNVGSAGGMLPADRRRTRPGSMKEIA